MKIKLFAHLCDWPIEASVDGDVITINGEAFDLSGIPEGYTLPGDAVGNKFFEGPWPIVRIDGILHFTLRLPVSEGTLDIYRDPDNPIIIDVVEGVVPLPNTTPVVEPVEIVEVPEDGGPVEA